MTDTGVLSHVPPLSDITSLFFVQVDIYIYQQINMNVLFDIIKMLGCYYFRDVSISCSLWILFEATKSNI